MLPKKPLQAYSDGVLSIFTVTTDENLGFRPEERLVLKGAPSRFATRTVGVSRFYAAKQFKEKIDKVVRVPRRGDICVLDTCKIGAETYTVRQVQAPIDVRPPSTDLSLERVMP